MSVDMQLLRESHFARQHQCCWLVGPDLGVPCELWCGHDGDHTPHQVGAYLRTPLLTPLDLLPLQRRGWMSPGERRCPCCSSVLDSLSCEPAYVHWCWEEEQSEGWETDWTFYPCRCTGREIHNEEQ